MKIGDLVTVLPWAGEVYIVTDFLREADTDEAQQELGSLWALYSEDQGVCDMHEKWIEIINEA
tara:strand:- start:3294 stop:3482 length:189 start_codon:yes stop_codon:yes gene_type:complete